MKTTLLSISILAFLSVGGYFLYAHYHPTHAKCPDDYATDEEQATAMEKWTNNFYDAHPGATLKEWGEARHQFWIDNHCTAALQRYDEAKAGKADPATMERIRIGIQEAINTSSNEVPPYDRDIVFLNEEKHQSLTDVHSIPLTEGKTLYFGIPANPDPSSYCGSGGCAYSVYFGNTYIPSKPTHLKPISGFDSYLLDCDTSKPVFYKDTSDSIFGFLTIDKTNKVVRVYYHLNVNLGSENIYHIANDGTPTLIASYDNTCDDPMKPATSTSVLFRDDSYPREFTVL